MQSTKRLKKVTLTENLTGKIGRSKSILITDYRGLSTSQLNELRHKFSEVSADYQIVKNTLLKRVLRSRGIIVKNDIFDGPTAVVYGYEDEISPIKTLLYFSRTIKLPVLKGGYLGDQLISVDQIETLAKLPNQDILRAQTVGTMYAPVINFVAVLNANIIGLLHVMNAIKEKMSNQ